MEARY